MIRLTRAQVQPIGLDIGHDSIKMLQTEVVGDTLSVRAAARQAFTPEAKSSPEVRMAIAVDMIRQMFRQNPFAGRRVIASLPSEIVHSKNLRLPLIPAAELASAVQYEAKNIFPFNTDDAQVHFLPAGDVRQGTDVRQEVIVIAARNEDVNTFLEQLHRSGAIVESLDVDALALFRTVERFIRRREDEQEVHVLVDVGFRRSQVVIGKGRDISFFKPIDIGGHHLQEAVGRKLGISTDEAQALRRRLVEAGEPTDPTAKRDPVRQAVFDATRSVMEDLCREISLCLRYYSVTFRGHRPSRLRVVGGEACDPQLQSLLNSTLTIPVEAGRPLYSADTARMKASDRRGTMSEWSQAFGLSLKLTRGHFGPRDGKPRDPNAPREDLNANDPSAKSPTGAQVIDLMKVLGEENAAAPVERVPPLIERRNGAERGSVAAAATASDSAGVKHA